MTSAFDMGVGEKMFAALGPLLHRRRLCYYLSKKQIDGLSVLTDPMFSERASANQFVGPKRFKPAALSVKDLPKVDVVLLSHNHYDHLDSGSVKAIGDGPLWVVPSGLKGWVAGGPIGGVVIVRCR